MFSLDEFGSLDPEQLVAEIAASCKLELEFEGDLGGKDNLTLAEHTIAVISAYDCFFAKRASLPISEAAFRVVLALHDLGKPRAMQENKPEKQHAHTLKLLSRAFQYLRISVSNCTKIESLIDSDPIGKHLNSKHNQYESVSLQEMHRVQRTFDVSATDAWALMYTYYQCDVCGYPSLQDKVFVFCDKRRPVWDNNTGGITHRDPDENLKLVGLKRTFLTNSN